MEFLLVYITFGYYSLFFKKLQEVAGKKESDTEEGLERIAIRRYCAVNLTCLWYNK